jgi:hypothetical protein
MISDVSDCPFLILFTNSIPLNVTSAFPNVLNPSDLIITDRLLEEAYGGRFISILSQQEIYSLALLIDRAIEMAPLPLHFDIGFINSPG